jgi:hypothetical protein
MGKLLLIVIAPSENVSFVSYRQVMSVTSHNLKDLFRDLNLDWLAIPFFKERSSRWSAFRRLPALPKGIITHSKYFTFLCQCDEMIWSTRNLLNIWQIFYVYRFINLEISLYLYKSLLEMIKEIYWGHRFLNFEDVNLTFLSENEQSLASESSLSDFRFSR